MFRARIASLAAALGLAGSFFTGAAADAACGSAPAMPRLSFARPSIVDGARAGGEPSVIATFDDTLIYASHAGTTHYYRANGADPDFVTPYTTAEYVWRSSDAGRTWRYVGLEGLGAGPHSTVSGFSDPTLAVDKAGYVYLAGIDLAQVWVAQSRDTGHTWQGRPFTVFSSDREWLAADQMNVVYMNANATPGGRTLWKSSDGGRTWNFSSGYTLEGSGPPSPIAVDQRDGRLYFPASSGESAFSIVQTFPRARSDDLTVTESYVREGLPHAFGFLNPIAIDRAGTVYIASNTPREVRVAHSTDRGKTWRTTIVHRSKTAVLWPWISAGSDGRVAVSWLQSDRANDDLGSVPAKYRIYAAQSVTGHGWKDRCGAARAPVYQVALATPQPIHDGTICTFGLGCQFGPFGVDRRLGDYHTNAITTSGTLVIAYADTTFKPGGGISHPGFVRQAAGVDFVKGR